MASGEKSPQSLVDKFPFLFVLFIGILVSGTGLLMAFIISVAHIAEIAGWRYANEWVPFQSGYLVSVQEIPIQLYNAVTYFSEASFIAFIFYPLAVTALAFYEVMQGEYKIILLGWVPFFSGVAIGLCSALLIDKD